MTDRETGGKAELAQMKLGELSDDQIVDILRKVTRDDLFNMLTFKRWKDGIDVDCPTFAAQWLAAEFCAATPALPSTLLGTPEDRTDGR